MTEQPKKTNKDGKPRKKRALTDKQRLSVKMRKANEARAQNRAVKAKLDICRDLKSDIDQMHALGVPTHRQASPMTPQSAQDGLQAPVGSGAGHEWVAPVVSQQEQLDAFIADVLIPNTKARTLASVVWRAYELYCAAIGQPTLLTGQAHLTRKLGESFHCTRIDGYTHMLVSIRADIFQVK